MQFQERFSTPLWAIQTTPETPVGQRCNYRQILRRADQTRASKWSYRTGGFSASSLLTFEVARPLESEGKTIAQLEMLDHYPTLFASPSFLLDDLSLASGQPSMAVIKAVVQSICECYLGDNAAARHDIARELRRVVEA
jgi:thioesterase domain-containing protein